jgi:hypothetical protein
MYPGIAAAGLRVKADQAVLARHGLWHDDEGAIVAVSELPNAFSHTDRVPNGGVGQ